MTNSESIKGADLALKEFDERFLCACASSELTKFKEVATNLQTTAEEVVQNLERMKKEKPLRDATTYTTNEENPLRGVVNSVKETLFGTKNNQDSFE